MRDLAQHLLTMSDMNDNIDFQEPCLSSGEASIPDGYKGKVSDGTFQQSCDDRLRLKTREVFLIRRQMKMNRGE